jgi:hypothetical protein
MVFGQRQGGSLSSCRHGSKLRFSRPFYQRRTPRELPCEMVGLLQPGNQLRIHVVDGVHANAVGGPILGDGTRFQSNRHLRSYLEYSFPCDG